MQAGRLLQQCTKHGLCRRHFMATELTPILVEDKGCLGVKTPIEWPVELNAHKDGDSWGHFVRAIITLD